VREKASPVWMCVQLSIGLVLVAWLAAISWVFISNYSTSSVETAGQDNLTPNKQALSRPATQGNVHHEQLRQEQNVAKGLNEDKEKKKEWSNALSTAKERNQGIKKRVKPEDWVEPPAKVPQGRNRVDWNGKERLWEPPPSPPVHDISGWEVDLSRALAQARMDPRRFPQAALGAPPEAIFTIPKGGCDRNNDHARMLEKVVVYPDAENEKPRILCASYTIQKSHKTQIKSIKHTWGSRCDGFVVFSDVEDPVVPSVAIDFEGPEEYQNIWQKVRAIWKYVWAHYREDFDWFYMGGDDVYLLMDNLRKYLLSDEIQKASKEGEVPLFLGRRFKLANDNIFNSGGAGYLLNRKSLEYLAKSLDKPFCRPHAKTFAEDVTVAACLREHGIHPFDTQDDWGRERFLPFTPGQHLRYRVPPKNPDWYAKYSIGLKTGLDAVSVDAISFHYVKVDIMYKIHSLLHFCNDVKEERDHFILDLAPK